MSGSVKERKREDSEQRGKRKAKKGRFRGESRKSIFFHSRIHPGDDPRTLGLEAVLAQTVGTWTEGSDYAVGRDEMCLVFTL